MTLNPKQTEGVIYRLLGHSCLRVKKLTVQSIRIVYRFGYPDQTFINNLFTCSRTNYVLISSLYSDLNNGWLKVGKKWSKHQDQSCW